MPINWSWKQALSSSALALLATTCVYAIPKGPCEPKSKNVCCEEPKPGPFAFSYPKDMNLACPSDFYFYGDFLVMQPMEDGLEFGVRDTNGNGSGSTELIGGTVLSFSSEDKEYDWDFGARIGLGFYLNHDAWTVDFQWLWYKTNQDISASTAITGVIIPQWIQGNTTAPATGDSRASERWEMKMNVFDIAIGKPFHVSRHLVFEPHFGLRAAWIDQNYLARYGGNYATEMSGKNDFWGLGSRIGFKSNWHLGSGIEMIANSSTSLLYSNFDVKQSLPLGTNSWSLNHDFYRNSSNLEMQLGVAWGMHFNDMQNHIKLQALWEFHNWYEQNQLRKMIVDINPGQYVNDTISRGDLSLSGLSFKVLFDF